MVNSNGKNLKTYLKELLKVANEDVSGLRGYDKLSEKQKTELFTAVGGLQNSLGDEISDILEKYGLKWD